jgi:hypothetical protein
VLNNFFMDFPRTCGTGIFLGVEPKMVRSNREDQKSPMVQANDGNGKQKWVATVMVKVLRFEQAKKENMEITVLSAQKPYAALPIGSPVVVEGLEVGILKQDRGGFSIFYSCENIRPATQERAASGQ